MAKKKVIKSKVATAMSAQKGASTAAAGVLATGLVVVLAWVAETWFHTPIPTTVQVAAAGLFAPFLWEVLPPEWEAN